MSIDKETFDIIAQVFADEGASEVYTVEYGDRVYLGLKPVTKTKEGGAAPENTKITLK